MSDDAIADFRISFLKELGVLVRNPEFFIRKINEYGYHEIIAQYLALFIVDPNSEELKLKRKIDFEDLYALYQLDQKLKNEIMISLQLFEQTFKVALTNEFSFQFARKKTNLIKKGQSSDEPELFAESYHLDNGQVIRRGDLKARIRHIRKNYLEPFNGYTRLYGQIEPWVLVKEMSFGVATNAFFLLDDEQARKNILKHVFTSKITLFDFERILEDMKLLRRRAAHNYRLLGIRKDGKYLYKTVLNDLSLLNNREPYEKAINNFKQINATYLQKYPYEEDFLIPMT